MAYPQLTIILPVHNGANYLHRAIGSVLNQTMDRDMWLLVAVNDGSTDNSAEILHSYEDRFPDNITVLDQDNRGVACARNLALRKTSTTWVTFLDQDDHLDAGLLESFLDYPHLDDVDVVIAGYQHLTSDGKIKETVIPDPHPEGFGRWTVDAAWAKMHRTSFLAEHDIEFWEGGFGEDIPFVFAESGLVGSRVAFLPRSGYNWLLNKESTSRRIWASSSPDTPRQIVDMISHLVTRRKSFDPTDPILDYYILGITVFFLIFVKVGNLRSFLAYYRALVQALAPLGDAVWRNRLIWHPIVGTPLRHRIVLPLIVTIHRTRTMPLFAPLVRMGRFLV
ncbi:MAG: glycosyltransferase [Propionibacteriaceae bacterium]|nr:glycosyltransferase [Propionibacteriaceae bacterium]